MGSAKDVRVITDPTPTTLGRGQFVFSDRYSIFDWGAMPDTIPNKGAAIALTAAWTFEKLKERGIETHYRGMVGPEGPVFLSELEKPSDTMEVVLTRVLPVDDDYARYAEEDNNYVLPIEIIFRNGLPKGSSVFRRLAKASEEEKRTILSKLGLTSEPKPGDLLSLPLYEFTTKFEPSDRNITHEEARRISGLAEQVYSKLLEMAAEANLVVTVRAREVGLDHWDGKLEAAIYNGAIFLVDVVGTSDENRFSYKGVQISKELQRQWYKTNNPEWVAAVSEAKATAKENRELEWRQFCEFDPVNLPEEVIELISDAYMAFTNHYTGKNWFAVPHLDDVVEQVKSLY